jgi:hypothetical protein
MPTSTSFIMVQFLDKIIFLVTCDVGQHRSFFNYDYHVIFIASPIIIICRRHQD